MLNKRWRLRLLLPVLLLILSLLLFRAFFYIPVPGFDPEKIERASSHKIENTVGPRIVDSLDVGQVVSSFPVGYKLMTVGRRQYVAYYDVNRQMTIAYRDVESRKWKYKKLDEKVKWDSHNYITIIADKKGYLHVSGNMHCVPLVYFRSTRPWDISSLERVNTMVGKQEKRVTYPAFMRGPGKFKVREI
ncbi:MAG: BNR-4 repeat-containing protein [Planctomycetes bacterium]|nr:BNR-4 repeat-containing protein [Planctomycetota bacterium]